MDWWAQEGAKVFYDSFKKSDFWALDAPEIHFLEQEADGKVNDYHYGQGADEQIIGKVVRKVLNFVDRFPLKEDVHSVEV